jgi:uncharacterized protein DUF5134
VFSSPALLVVLTAVFAVTGLYSLVRLSALASGAATDGDRMAELSHLLMSVGMLGMAWGRTGGPGTPSGVVQLVVFGLLSAWFLVHVLRRDGHRRVGAAYHLLVQVAMVWMVAVMPALMGMGGAAPASAAHDHDGHGGTGGTGEMARMTTSMAPPLWIQVVTVGFVVLLGAAALAWATAAVRPARVPVPVAPAGPPVPRPAPARPSGIRLDAGCHLLMSLGMAGMLMAML